MDDGVIRDQVIRDQVTAEENVLCKTQFVIRYSEFGICKK